MNMKHQVGGQNSTPKRQETVQVTAKRHIVRYGPDWADIIVIEGQPRDEDETKALGDKHGVQSSEIFDAWARPET
jgi:hypothetical protein